MRFLAGIILSFFVILGCSTKDPSTAIQPAPVPPPIGRKPTASQRALIFGDSLAVGFGSTQYSNTLSACFTQITGQTSLLKAQSGATSTDVLEQVKAAHAEAASLVFLSFGGNDVIRNLYGSNFDEQLTYNNFEEISSELAKRTTPVIYLVLSPPYKGSDRLPYLGTLALKKNWIVVDGMKGFWNQRKYMSDEIHPNDTGYKIMCDRIKAALKAAKL